MKWARKKAKKMPYASTGSSPMNVGLGMTSWIRSAPSMIAVTMSPGMPSAIIMIKAPPAVALLADSEATTPSAIPVPNFSGVLDAFLA